MNEIKLIDEEKVYGDEIKYLTSPLKVFFLSLHGEGQLNMAGMTLNCSQTISGRIEDLIEFELK